MNYERHIAAAESFLREEGRLSNEGGAGMLSAEAVWGAAVQAINAVNHAQGSRRAHVNKNYERRQVVHDLEAKYGAALNVGFQAALRDLHNHFYGGHLSETELAVSLNAGRRFVSAMIELSARELSELESGMADCQ